MTIQEKIQKKAEGYGKLAPVFLEGAEFALENQWISVKDDLPYNHKELLDLLNTKFVISINAKGTVELNYMIDEFERGWKWAFKKYYDILYWMRIPELPEANDELQLPSANFDNNKAKFASEPLEENEWIDVDEDLPYNHKELLLTESSTVDVLTKDENEDISSDFMIKFNNEWCWNENSDYSYWKIMPTN